MLDRGCNSGRFVLKLTIGLCVETVVNDVHVAARISASAVPPCCRHTDVSYARLGGPLPTAFRNFGPFLVLPVLQLPLAV